MTKQEMEAQELRLRKAKCLMEHISKTEACARAFNHPEVRISIGVRVPAIGSATKADGATMSTDKEDGHPFDFRGHASEALFKALARQAIDQELGRLKSALADL